jgi:trimethylguanosine synthase
VPVAVASGELDKYYAQRYKLFSRYDEGVWLEDEAWFSATPELVSAHIAEKLLCGLEDALVLDLCCGAGGNTIQLALLAERVIAVDIDPHRVEMARNNCQVYQVDHKVHFITADVFDVLAQLDTRADAIFLGPPWGGPGYLDLIEYDVSRDMPIDLRRLVLESLKHSDRVCVVLPRNVSWVSVSSVLSGAAGVEIEMECNVLDSKLKLLTAYISK